MSVALWCVVLPLLSAALGCFFLHWLSVASGCSFVVRGLGFVPCWLSVSLGCLRSSLNVSGLVVFCSSFVARGLGVSCFLFVLLSVATRPVNRVWYPVYTVPPGDATALAAAIPAAEAAGVDQDALATAKKAEAMGSHGKSHTLPSLSSRL